MGGFGSGWRRARTYAVEDCLVLSTADLVREKVIVPGAVKRGVLAWSQAGKQPDAQVTYEADLLTDKHAAIQLRYRIDDRSENTYVWLRFTVPQYGGRRWWFVCPLTGDRVAKLYLPAGAKSFRISPSIRFSLQIVPKKQRKQEQKVGCTFKVRRKNARKNSICKAHLKNRRKTNSDGMRSNI
jgi:hypothetical protein